MVRGKLAGREPRAFPDEFVAQIRLVYSKKSTLIILIHEGSSRLAHWPSQLSLYGLCWLTTTTGEPGR